MSKLHFMPGSVEPEPAAHRIIKEMWSQGETMQCIAEAVGMTARRIDHLRAAGRLDLPSRGRGAGHKFTQRLPSPSEIRKRCAAVRAGWDEATEQARRAGSGRVLSDTALRQTPLPFGRSATQRGMRFLQVD